MSGLVRLNFVWTKPEALAGESKRGVVQAGKGEPGALRTAKLLAGAGGERAQDQLVSAIELHIRIVRGLGLGKPWKKNRAGRQQRPTDESGPAKAGVHPHGAIEPDDWPQGNSFWALTADYRVDWTVAMSQAASPRVRRRNGLAIAIVRLIPLALFACLTAGLAHAQSPDEVRRMLAAIHDDQVPYNCLHATTWLFQHRESLKDELLDHLYQPTTDAQSRDAIMHVLFNTTSFVPNGRFCGAVIRRLSEQDTKVANAAIFELGRDVGDLQRVNLAGVQWEAWPFIDKHFSTFQPLLRQEIGKTGTVFVLWATAWLFKKRGLLQNDAALFTPVTLERAAENLRDDNKASNASQAVRLFLLLGKQSLPTLQKTASSGDRQARFLSQATIDAINGRRPAFVYLSEKLNLINVPFGEKPIEPEWLVNGLEKAMSEESDSDEVRPYP